MARRHGLTPQQLFTWRREARHATPRESQRFVDRFGHTEPYGWSEDKARQYSVPERHSFGPFIRGHGFTLA